MLFLLVGLTVVGLANAGYLVWKQHGPGRSRGPLVCPFGQACEFVLASKYGRMFFGIPNTIVGVGYYAVTLVLLLAAWQAPIPKILVWGQGIEPLRLAFYLSIPAFIASVILTAIQHFVLKNYCSYCLFANFLNTLLFIGLLAYQA